ncbi:MAG: hypothetical protein IJG24_07870 [Selenomonadaceae bacterium]|nr:hypothetical protein [Selenomonadaceae bacterium]
MKNSELLQLNPQHLAELRSFFSGFEFDDVEILASEEVRADNDHSPETFGFDHAVRHLKFDGVIRGKNHTHITFTDGESDCFYCFSYALVGGVEERIIFKLIRREESK